MAKLRTNRITVRGEEFEVCEVSGEVMMAVRKLLADPILKTRAEVYVAYRCCVNPKFETEAEASKLAYGVIDAISDEAWRLMREDTHLEKKVESVKRGKDLQPATDEPI